MSETKRVSFHKSLKPTKVMGVFYAPETFRAGSDLVIPKNSLVGYFGQNVYLVTSFPVGYKGKNPWLYVHSYDQWQETWSQKEPTRDRITATIWKAFLSGRCKQTTYADMDDLTPSKPIRKHKSRSDGSYRDYVSAITDYACGKMPQWADWR